MLLDDSSGTTIEITCGRPKQADLTSIMEDKNVFDKKMSISDCPTVGLTATGREIDVGGIDVGTVVKAKGGISVWRGEKQMQLERICTYADDPSICYASVEARSRPFLDLC